MDVEQARFNMIEQQIRTWEVLDSRVLDLLFRVKREDYVPAAYRNLAFADMEIPLGQGEAMLAPKLEARMLQEANVQDGDRVLEIGTGSGYMCALIASLAKHVYSVDIVAEFVAEAGRKLEQHGLSNLTLECGDAARGWEKHAPYDVIIVTGSLPYLPPEIEASLGPNGRLIAIIGDEPIMTAKRVHRVSDAAFTREGLFETYVKALRNVAQPERFVF